MLFIFNKWRVCKAFFSAPNRLTMASSHEDSDDFEEDGNDTTLANNCIVILVKFLDETYGVVTMSSLVKPKFPDQLPFDDCITLLQKWIKDKTPCSIRFSSSLNYFKCYFPQLILLFYCSWDIEQEIWNLFNYAAPVRNVKLEFSHRSWI